MDGRQDFVRRARPKSVPLLVLWSAVGCGSPEHINLAWPALAEHELAFVVTLDGSRLRASHGPYGLEELSAGAGASLIRELVPSDAILLVVSLDPREVARMVPGFQDRRARELRLAIRSSPCARLEEDGSTLLSLQATSASIRRLDGDQLVDDSTPKPELRVVAPTDSEGCFSDPTPALVPFGASLELLPVGSSIGGIIIENHDSRTQLIWADRLGPDLVAAATRRALLVFDRGAPWGDEPSRRWLATELPARPWQGGWGLTSMELVAPLAESSPARMLGTAVWTEPDDHKRSAIVFEIEWTPQEGFDAPRILFEEENAQLRATYRMSDDTLVAVGDDALVVAGRAPGQALERLGDLGVPSTSNLRRIAPGPSSAEPLAIIDSRHRLYFGSVSAVGSRLRRESAEELERGTYALVDVVLEGGERLYFWDTDVAEVWRRQPDGRRGVFEYVIPRGFEGCAMARDECGARSLTADRSVLARGPVGRVILAPGSCSAVLEIDARSGCARGLLLENLAPVAEPRGTLNAASFRDGVLTVVGARGRVLQAVWPK